MITIEWAKDPVYADETKQVINLIVKFVEFNDPLPFAATSYDPMSYGRVLYSNAINGDYGAVSPYISVTADPAPIDDQPTVSGINTL